MLDNIHHPRNKEIPNQNVLETISSFLGMVDNLFDGELLEKEKRTMTVSFLLRDRVVSSGVGLRLIMRRPTKVQWKRGLIR